MNNHNMIVSDNMRIQEYMREYGMKDGKAQLVRPVVIKQIKGVYDALQSSTVDAVLPSNMAYVPIHSRKGIKHYIDKEKVEIENKLWLEEIRETEKQEKLRQKELMKSYVKPVGGMFEDDDDDIIVRDQPVVEIGHKKEEVVLIREKIDFETAYFDKLEINYVEKITLGTVYQQLTPIEVEVQEEMEQDMVPFYVDSPESVWKIDLGRQVIVEGQDQNDIYSFERVLGQWVKLNGFPNELGDMNKLFKQKEKVVIGRSSFASVFQSLVMKNVDYAVSFRKRFSRRNTSRRMVQAVCVYVRNICSTSMLEDELVCWNREWSSIWRQLNYGMKYGYQAMMWKYGLSTQMQTVMSVLFEWGFVLGAFGINKSGYVWYSDAKTISLESSWTKFDKGVPDIWVCILARVEPYEYWKMRLVSRGFNDVVVQRMQVRFEEKIVRVLADYPLMCDHNRNSQGYRVLDKQCKCYKDNYVKVYANYVRELLYLQNELGHLFMFEPEIFWCARKLKMIDVEKWFLLSSYVDRMRNAGHLLTIHVMAFFFFGIGFKDEETEQLMGNMMPYAVSGQLYNRNEEVVKRNARDKLTKYLNVFEIRQRTQVNVVERALEWYEENKH